MKIKDIIYIVCGLCGNSVLAESVKNSEIKKDDEDIKRMIDCYNLVISELSEEALPLVFRQTLTSENGDYPYSSFTKPPKQILNVYENGRELDFKVYPDYVHVNANEVEIVYDYIGAVAKSIDDKAEYGNILSARVIALGVASEYLLISGLYNEAMSMRKKFERAITAFKQRKSRRVKARRWW